MLTGGLFHNSDFDLFVTYQAAEALRTKLLEHTRLVCIDEHVDNYEHVGSRLHHVENYALEPPDYRMCLPFSPCQIVGHCTQIPRDHCTQHSCSSHLGCSCPPRVEPALCISPYTMACEEGRLQRIILQRDDTAPKVGQPNCCGDKPFPIDKLLNLGTTYLQLIVGLPSYDNVLQLTAAFDIVQCRISYDGASFRLVSPFVLSSPNLLFNRWLSLSHCMFDTLSHMLTYHCGRTVTTSGPDGDFHFKAACATLYRLRKYHHRRFELGLAPRYYSNIAWMANDSSRVETSADAGWLGRIYVAHSFCASHAAPPAAAPPVAQCSMVTRFYHEKWITLQGYKDWSKQCSMPS